MSRALVIITALQLLPAGAVASEGYVVIAQLEVSQRGDGCDLPSAPHHDTLEAGGACADTGLHSWQALCAPSTRAIASPAAGRAPATTSGPAPRAPTRRARARAPPAAR
ncbi:MAG: hypothetical protein KC503_37870 [Myxococcales bacterium]|nr:hypothetical protein [Myxococcales bacterium]